MAKKIVSDETPTPDFEIPEFWRERLPGTCMVSKQVTEDGLGVGYMTKGEPDLEITSGWRFLSGHETPEYAGVASNFEIKDLVDVAIQYGDTNVLFSDAEIGEGFRRDPESTDFYSESFMP